LSVLTEKVVTTSRPLYFNYSTPEPRSFWGYIQTVQRDFITRTIPLEYRRQAIVTRDEYELEPIEQLRCLVKTSTLAVFDLVGAAFLAAGGDAEDIGQRRAQYLLDVGQPRFIPTMPETGLYYEIEAGLAARITIIWQGYLEPCDNPGGVQYLQPPRGLDKGEASGDATGGGGTRPNTPIPDDLDDDPGSDNSGPPSGTPDSPTSDPNQPPPFTGWVRVVWGGGAFLLDNCVEEPFGPITIDIAIPSADAVITVKDPVPGLEYQVCGQTVNDYIFFIEVNGQGVGEPYGPAKFVTFPEIISVTPIPPP